MSLYPVNGDNSIPIEVDTLCPNLSSPEPQAHRDLYSEDARLATRPGHNTVMVFLILCRKMPLKIDHDRFLPHPLSFIIQ